MTEHVGLLRESWEARAQDWINWVRAPGQPDSYWRFHREKFLKLVPAPAELTVDIGCGEGRVGRDLLELGHKVLGIDRSPTMIDALANHPTSVPAVVADAVQLPLADASADCAIAFMSLQDIDDMRAAVKEAARVLKDGRHLVLAIVHPVYSGGEFSNTDTNACFVLSQPYFKFERRTRNDVRGDMTMVFDRQHRPLHEYAQALTEADFIIEQLHEVTEPDETKLRNRVPMFLDIRAKRLPRENPTRTGARMEGSVLVS
jgi:ubiquinone/menaquinone biosynthesis C-methylase UbiE